MFKKIGRQLKRPSGLLGRIVSIFMDFRNRKFYKKALIELDIQEGDKIFEIGFGSGFGIFQIAKNELECTIHGIDFSELMVCKASKKNRKFIIYGKVNLSYGDFLSADFNNEKYDKIFSGMSFISGKI